MAKKIEILGKGRQAVSTNQQFVNRQGDLVHATREDFNARKSVRAGKAYAFFDYEGRWTELIGHLGVANDQAKHSDYLSLMVLDDKVSSRDMDTRVRNMYEHGPVRLPKQIVQYLQNLDTASEREADFRYLIMAQAKVSHSDSPNPVKQGRANQRTAALLLEILSYVTEGERKIGADTRTSVFFIDDYRMVQRLM